MRENSNPYSSKANLHHTETYRSEEDWYTDNFGKGEADPDRVGYYPNEKQETWSRVQNSNHEINMLGTVRHLITKRVLKCETDRDGYLRFAYKVDSNKWKHKLVHRAVAEAFLPNSLNKLHVNHKDCNRKNNDISNLEWCTPAENHKHAEVFGNFLNNFKRGELHHSSKLTDVQAINIRHMRNEVDRNTLASYYGVNPTTIYDIWMGRTWKHLGQKDDE